MRTNSSPRFLFAAGGTGGHIYPAIAIADAIRKQNPQAAIAFAGTRDRMEWQAVPKAGYEIHPITVSGFQRSLSLRNLSFPFKLLQGLRQSWRLVKAFDPDVVIGTGGYVSGPLLWSAQKQKRPTVIQEQNAFAGVTNKILGKKAFQAFLAFPEAKQYFNETKCQVLGNPTRNGLADVDKVEARKQLKIPDEAQVLFVFGGSLGSPALNRIVQQKHQEIKTNKPLVILWQTGSRHYDKIITEVESTDSLRIMKYVDRMDVAYAASDLVLCRAGAITCSELMVVGRPAVLVPAPNVAEDHQTKNAEAMVNINAAMLLPETNLQDKFVKTIELLLNDPNGLKKMAESAKNQAKPDAADKIATYLLNMSS